MTQSGDDGGSISSNESTYLLSPASTTPANEMIFVIAAHGGLTRKLHKAAPCKASVLVEGPYSVPHNMACDTLVLVAGGTGIALIQAIWEGIVKKPADRPRRLIVVWTVKKLGKPP
jgi:NAD(P)H-flavin reductase